jgi:NAD(P)-dependent dehydrogenase (short-subunit alcohol dehydrogenase family)
MKLEGRVAIVTGGARGLGRAYALRLATLGADVAVVDINLQGAADFGEMLTAESVPAEIRALGRRSIGLQSDLGQRSLVNDVVRQVKKELGRVDILVNNAGGAITPVDRSFASTVPDEDLELISAANLMSTIYCCQAVVPIMREQKSGAIVNISSTAGITTVPGGRLAHYAMAKAAVTHYTRYLASEVGPYGIRVNCIAPGIILTSRVAAQSAARNIGTGSEVRAIPLRRMGMPEDCAKVLEFLVTDLSDYVTGQCISVCGGAVLTPS